MLIPVNPSKSLVRSAPPTVRPDDDDVTVEVVPPVNAEARQVGRAKVSGRSVIMNRKGP